MVKFSVLKGLYDVEKTIGCGGFAKVKLATHVVTGEKVAIKIMDKTILGDDLPRVELELKALKSLSHENICKLYQVLETDSHFFLVTEYCSGGELFDHIVEKNRLSEIESRMFFRQIVSAVAYLHSLGYAHRDLKPENVLLDKDQTLKLIDFGLCAKPDGGMDSPLFTSCGSPTYAAPELVLGRKYLGPEVDVWAMGVLLYALLAGYLPFDDLNIDALYKKILSGKYEEPKFISEDSRALISSMLQVDPKKRITVKELLSHPWLTLGVLDSVEFRSLDSKQYEPECVNFMAKHCQVDPLTLWTQLKKWDYDYQTATYLILMSKRKRGVPMKLYGTPDKLWKQNLNKPPSVKRTILGPLNIEIHPAYNLNNDVKTPPNTPNTPTSLTNFVYEISNPPSSTNISSPSGDFVPPRRPSTIRKPMKRIRSPTLDGDGSPIPAKKPTPTNTPCTPERKALASSAVTPSPSRGMFSSLERSLHKVRKVLTPRKAPLSEYSPQPILLSGKMLCNVSTTQYHDPEFVINQLSKALGKKGIHCDRKGFTLRGKMEPDFLGRHIGGCSFELEICYLPIMCPSKSLRNDNLTPVKPTTQRNGQRRNFHTSSTKESSRKDDKSSSPPALVGIRRKRLKGDSWCYKKVCEQVLALTSNDLQVAESSV